MDKKKRIYKDITNGETYTADEMDIIVTRYNETHNDGSRLYFTEDGVNYQGKIDFNYPVFLGQPLKPIIYK